MQTKKEILSRNWAFIALYAAIGVICAFLEAYKASFFQQIVDGLTHRTEAVTGTAILLYGGLMILLFLLHYLDNYPEKRLEHGLYLDFKLLALQKVSRMDFAVYQQMGTGGLVQRIENGAQAGKGILFDFWIRLCRELIPTIFFSLLFICRISRSITAAVLGGYVVVFIITNLLVRALYKIKEGILINEEKLNHFLVRGFMEMPVFRMQRQFEAEIKKAEAAKGEIVASKTKMTMIHEAFFAIFAILVALLDIGILLYVWFTGSISVGAAVALITLLDNAFTPIAIFNVLYVQYKLDGTAFKRYEEFLSALDDPQLLSGAQFENYRGEIKIQNLNFSYGGQSLFQGLNLSIAPGERVAFVGESGSGKSTLLKLIAGMLKYTSGSIQIDGRELSELNLNNLYRHLSYLTQDAAVFDGTLRENLVFDREEEDAVLQSVLENVQLSKMDLNIPVGEQGALLSGGEKQRVALARLWVEKREIILLDEATSALDSLTEEYVMEELEELLRGKTVIAVAHRLSSVQNFDRIVAFREGEIIAEGTFDRLLNSSEYFAELYRASQQQEI